LLSPRSAYRIFVVTFVSLIVGAVASLASLGFVDAVVWLNHALLISSYSRIQYEAAPHVLMAATILVPTLGGLLVGLILTYLVREGRALGPPDVILAVQTRKIPSSLWSGLASTFAGLISLGAGASVGQYGILVYIGTMVGALAARLEKQIRDTQSVAIASGVAAALASAFNAPITGAVFAHEVILRHYSLRAFAPVTVAAATGYVMANVVLDRPALFLVEFDGVQHGYEFILFAIEGILCSFIAVLFITLVQQAQRLARALPIGPALRPALAGLVLGLVALQVPEVLSFGRETLRFATIEGAFTGQEVVLIVIAKMLMTAMCTGFGFVGGVFNPAMLIGILSGGLFWMLWTAVLPLAQSGLVPYAICGMMAVTSPVIGAPLTTILIVFELTRNYDLTVAAMVAVVFSNLFAHRAFGRSQFDLVLRRRGFDLSLGRDKAILSHRPVSAFARFDYVALHPDDTVDTLLDRLTADDRAEAMLIDGKGRYAGTVRLLDAVGCARQTPLGSLARSESVVFDETTTLWDAMIQMRHYIGEAVPLVASRDRRLLGVVPEAAVLEGYLEAVHELRREENASV